MHDCLPTWADAYTMAHIPPEPFLKAVSQDEKAAVPVVAAPVLWPVLKLTGTAFEVSSQNSTSATVALVVAVNL
jgi:hypothetical protein